MTDDSNHLSTWPVAFVHMVDIFANILFWAFLGASFWKYVGWW